MARILSRRADGAPSPVIPAEDAAPVDQPTGVVPVPADGSPSEAPTTVLPADGAAAGATAPPGDDLAEAPAEQAAAAPAEEAAEPVGSPSFRDRGRLRRRLRYLRRVRELGFRDLGGLVFDLDRFGRDRPDLVRAKLDALGGIDRELRTLEIALQDERPIEELREPGIAACPHCGGLHGSDARFCPSCGAPVGAARGPAPSATLSAAGPVATSPASPRFEADPAQPAPEPDAPTRVAQEATADSAPGPSA